MQKVFLFLLIFIPPLSASANTFITRTVDWKKVEVIKYSTSSEFYDIKIWVTTDATSLKDIMLQNNAISWANGVFECPKDYTACWWKSYTINERYVEWEKIATYKSTWDRVVFWWDKNIAPFLFQTDKINPEKEWEIYEWFANFPLLLQEWRLMTEYYYEVNLIDEKMLIKQSRNFICSDEKQENIYFWYIGWVTLDEAGILLLKLWCYNALNLDAGYSKAFIYNYQYLKWPWRDILDWVFIVPKNIDFNKEKKILKTRVNNILEKLKTSTLDRKISVLDDLINQLNMIYTKIHENQTKEIFEIVEWEKVKVWEETNFNNNDLIKRIYTINTLKFYLYEINKIFKKINELNKYKLDIKIDIWF